MRDPIDEAFEKLKRLLEARGPTAHAGDEEVNLVERLKRELDEARNALRSDTGETWEDECMRARAERDAAIAHVERMQKFVDVAKYCRDYLCDASAELDDAAEPKP